MVVLDWTILYFPAQRNVIKGVCVTNNLVCYVLICIAFRWIRMPGYELEKSLDGWWRLIPRMEEFNLTDISDDDLKSRANYVEIAVNSPEHCSR